MATIDRHSILEALTTIAEAHPFHADALGAEYADWCGTGSYGTYCSWSPGWASRNDLDDAREQHAEHLMEEQARAIAALLGIPSEDH